MVKIGLIGCGVWGRKILASLLNSGQEIIVVESEANCRASIEADYSVKCLANINDLPAVDGFIVATPASTHAEVVLEILKYGLPIFVEKPLTTNVRDAHELVKAGGNLIFVMHIWQYHPGVIELAKIASEGSLGAINVLRTTRKNWTSPRVDVDTSWTMLPHDISITKAIIGHVPQPLFAQAEVINGRAVGVLAVLGNEPPQVIIDTSNRYENKQREIRLHCEKGVACLSYDDCGYITISREDGTAQHQITIKRREFEHHSPLDAELKCFIAHICGGPPPPTNINVGVEVVEAVAMLRQLAGLSSGAIEK